MSDATSGLFKAIVQFTNGDGMPLTGPGWEVAAYDEDPLRDQCLGRAALDDRGRAHFLFSVSDIKSLDSPGERTPDLYFVLTYKGNEIYRSEVIDDVDFEAMNRVSGETASVTRIFGPYAVDTR